MKANDEIKRIMQDTLVQLSIELDKIVGDDKDQLQYQWPVMPKYKVVRHDMYGMRDANYNTYKPRHHSGFDITIDVGTPLKSMLPGIVISTGVDEVRDENGNFMFNTKYGNKVEILQADGNIACYGHLRDINVKVGDIVDYDTIIAHTGCSGGSRVPHLHFEIRKGLAMKGTEETTYDPLEILPDIGIMKIQTPFTQEPYAHLWNIMNSDKPFGFTHEDIWWENDPEIVR